MDSLLRNIEEVQRTLAGVAAREAGRNGKGQSASHSLGALIHDFACAFCGCYGSSATPETSCPSCHRALGTN